MAKFTKITAETVTSNEALYNYLLNAGRITAGKKGGVFVGNRDIAPDSLREFGIVLPKGGMILPNETLEEIKAVWFFAHNLKDARFREKQQRLETEWAAKQLKVFFIYMNHDWGVVGVLEHPTFGALYVFIPTSSHSFEGEGIHELPDLNDQKKVKITSDKNSSWASPLERKRYVLSPKARSQLIAGLHKLRDGLTKADLGDEGPGNFNQKAFGFKTQTHNLSLDEAKSVIDWVISQI